MDGVGRVIDEDSEIVGVEGARTRQRDSLFMTAQLRIAGADPAHEVRVRNLSPGGLMIEFDRAIDSGAPVTLEMRGLGKLAGTVAWCTRGRIGVALDQPIDPKRARKPVGAGTTTPEYAKPALVGRPKRK